MNRIKKENVAIKKCMIEKDKLILHVEEIEASYCTLVIYMNKQGEIFEKILMYYANEMPVLIDVYKITDYKLRATEEDYLKWLEDENDENNRIRNPT